MAEMYAFRNQLVLVRFRPEPLMKQWTVNARVLIFVAGKGN